MSSFKIYEQALDFDTNRPELVVESRTLKDICWQFRRMLLWNDNYLFSLPNIVYLLDNLSRSKYAPRDLGGMLMGQAVLFALKQKETLHKMGTKGTAFQQQQKEVVITSGLQVKNQGEKNTITAPQRKLVNNIIPHNNKNEKAKYVSKTIHIRAKFDDEFNTNNFLNKKQTNISLCDAHEPQKRQTWTPSLIDNMINEWCTKSNPSPSKRDIRRKRDKSGNICRNANNEKESWILSMYMMNDKDVYSNWKKEPIQLYNTACSDISPKWYYINKYNREWKSEEYAS
eukprot:540168_1